MGVTKIEWTSTVRADGTVAPGYTFNPWMGCSKVAPGCAHCYAETLMDTRWGKVQWGPNGTRVMASPATWKNPLKWNRDAEKAGERRRVFCASLADVFEDWQGPIVNAKGEQVGIEMEGEDESGDDWEMMLPGGGWRPAGVISARRITRRPATMDDLRKELFETIDATPHLDWLLLTKRPENVLKMWPVHNRACYRPNVWLLTSVSEQESADKNIPELLKCRDLVPVLGISAEPLLGPLTFHWAKWQPFNEATGKTDHLDGLRRLDWVILGGESGRGARECDTDNISVLVEECEEAGVPVFVKQLGANPVFGKERHLLSMDDAKGGNWDEWPCDLRRRQFPQPTEATA